MVSPSSKGLNALVLLFLFLVITPSFQIYPTQAKNNQQSYDLITKLSNITIGYVSIYQINVSFEYEIYNPNQVNYEFQATDPCGLVLAVTMNAFEGDNVGINFIENSCFGSPSTQVYNPGLTIQQVKDATIFIKNWDQYGVNDLPLAEYYLDVDHSSVNMQSFGVHLNYNSTGQFFINYDSSPYSFWISNDQNYQTIIPNQFLRTGVIPFIFSSGVTETSYSVSGTDPFFIGLLGVGFILVVIIVYLQRNSNKKLSDKLKTDIRDDGIYNQAKQEFSCPNCGNPVASADIFCQFCGKQL